MIVQFLKQTKLYYAASLIKKIVIKAKLKFFSFNITENFIIIKVDGGICSQIAFMALGKYFNDKGYQVKYDLDWFSEYGKDLNGIFVRNFDIDKAFPQIKIPQATSDEIYRYKNLFKSQTNNCTPPAYIDEYMSQREISLVEDKEYFSNLFNPIDKEILNNILFEIESTNSCGVHVRRGDLSIYNSAYGYPKEVDYYLKAIDTIMSSYENSVFFFFSDEPIWVKENIFPKLRTNLDCRICDINGSDKGYLDLYLMTKCNTLIAAHGSLAFYAKILSKKNPSIVISEDKSNLLSTFENVLILN